LIAPLFRDPDVQAQFARDGYVTMPFLEESALVELRQLFAEVREKVALKGFATTTTSPDFALKKSMFERIQPYYAAQVDRVFRDYKLLGTSFLQKDSGASGSLPLHQDWMVTDEEHFRTVTIWVPLEDCGLENGAIQMLPGSHQYLNLLRGPNLPVAIREIAPELEKELVTLTLKAGEAVIFDHSILHKSTLNISGRPRVALTYGLTQHDAPLSFWYHHAGDAADRFEQIAVPDDFFLQYHHIGQRPTIGQSLGFYRHDLRPVSLEECVQMLEGNPLMRNILQDISSKDCLLPKPQYAITQKSGWNRTLAENGYVTFPLLNADEVAHLKDFFTAHQHEKVERFYASVHNPDTDFRERMNAEIQNILRPQLALILDDSEALGASFIAKPRGNPGILPPHADWNIVDERLYRSYNLWIPLVDTTVANGAVHVIPGSHAWLDYFRGPGIPNPFEPHKADVWEAMQALEMPAGTALLYDHRLLHASPVNQTDALRLACVLGIKPKAAQMRYYCGEGKMVQEYAANPTFFMYQNPEKGPADLAFLRDVTDILPSISAAELRAFLGWEAEAAEDSEAAAAPMQRGFWETYSPGNIWREIRWRLSGKL
jgi:ectoine hydroxylase-related dioxygenase (phytanoyl-CoA dioxygenase family)